ncbi:MAG: polymer-forming cytoskeletal protein [Myxococcales bacterium]|jgi:cytoskeletal protein CcmA (bactofilin family)|nr:polymer-forming cytoskeletal protein [Myxococcales bacterium]
MAQEGSSIGKGTLVRGDVVGAAALSIEGRLEGRLQLSARLTVEPTGQLDAEVWAEDVAIHGVASGSIEANATILVSAVATARAALRAPRVVIEDGARFSGDIDMGFELPEAI